MLYGLNKFGHVRVIYRVEELKYFSWFSKQELVLTVCDETSIAELSMKVTSFVSKQLRFAQSILRIWFLNEAVLIIYNLTHFTTNFIALNDQCFL